MNQTLKSGSCRRASTRKMEGGKRKLSGYMKFVKVERKKLTAQNPKMKFTAVGKELGKRWRALSLSEKKKYN